MLAFVAVQGASILQGAPPAAVMKGELVTEPDARSQVVQPVAVSSVQAIAAFVLGPLAVAVLCYLFVKKIV